MDKKILHIPFGGLNRGGVSSVVFSIVENLYETFEFDSVVFSKKCEREQEFERYGNLYRIKGYPVDEKRDIIEQLFRPFVFTGSIYRLCKRNKYDVVHAHNGPDEGFCLLGAKLAGVPVRIAHSHNTASTRKRSAIIRIYEKIGRKLILATATDLIGCTEAACKDFFGIERGYEVIYNSVNLERFNCKTPKTYDQTNFIHVGRYAYPKNQEKVLDVFHEILKYRDDSKLLLVGFGENEEKLREKIHSLGIEKYVEMVPGNKTDVVPLYEQSNYMIFPSFYEGFGIVLIEAQAMGVYCFVSDRIQPDANAGLMQVIELEKSAGEWAREILSKMENCKRQTIEPNNHLLAQFSTKVIAEQYKNLYMKK